MRWFVLSSLLLMVCGLSAADTKAPWSDMVGERFNTIVVATLRNVRHNADTLLFHRNERAGREFWAIHDWGELEVKETLKGEVDSTHVQVSWFVRSHHVLPPGQYTYPKHGLRLESDTLGIWILNMGGEKLEGRTRFVYLPMDSLAAVRKFIGDEP